ncbi:unnamed protein product [Caenorhabditis bovis]|uniref:Uncharacterized protein n=1 Tax=Caenorhabditis bovis TaxID=2654633 RepID=A0A8S1EYR9_9PELO|nr:unnamed protein product [Caenorhabditis bovis]
MSSKKDASIGWMYEGAKSSVNREDYLLGKKVDKNFEKYSDVVVDQAPEAIDTIVQNRTITTQQKDVKTTLLQKEIIKSEDPFVAVKVREETKRREIMDNPLMKKKLQTVLRQMMTAKNEKKHKKKKSKKHKKEKKRSRSSDSSSSDSEEERSRSLLKEGRRDRQEGQVPLKKGANRNLRQGEEFHILDLQKEAKNEDRDLRKSGEQEENRHHDRRDAMTEIAHHRNGVGRLKEGIENDHDLHHQLKNLGPDRLQDEDPEVPEIVRHERIGDLERVQSHMTGKNTRIHVETRLVNPNTPENEALKRSDHHQDRGRRLGMRSRRRQVESEEGASSEDDSKRYDSDDDAADKKKKSFGLVEMRTKDEKTVKNEDDDSKNVYSLIKIPTGRGGNASREKRERKVLTDEEKAARLKEMQENAKWREEVRARNMNRDQEDDKEELEELDKNGYAPSFIRNQMRDACDDMTVEKRLQSNKKGVQRSHGYMDRSFARK